jgi:hypothetical protein
MPAAARLFNARNAARRQSTETWCRSARQLLLAVPVDGFSYAGLRLGHGLSGSASGPCFASPHSPWSTPSLHRLRRSTGHVVRRLPRYSGWVRLLRIVHHGLRPPAFPVRPQARRPRAMRRPPGSRAGDVRTCQGLRRRGAVRALAIACPTILPSAGTRASALRMIGISPLNGWPMRSPVNASRVASRRPAHDSGPVWIATPSP